MKLLEHIFGIKEIRGFKPGDIVEFISNKHVYVNYSQMMKHHPQYALRWAYKCRIDFNHKYKILKIYPHVMENPDDVNNYCLIIEDIVTHQIFMAGELSFKKIK